MTEITPRAMAQGQLEAELERDLEWFEITINNQHFEATRLMRTTYYIGKKGKIFKQENIQPWICYDCGHLIKTGTEGRYCPKC